MPAFDLPVRLRVKRRGAHVNSWKSCAMSCGPLSVLPRFPHASWRRLEARNRAGPTKVWD
jgi:hypothetical protein